jgi:hypothetical protein
VLGLRGWFAAVGEFSPVGTAFSVSLAITHIYAFALRMAISPEWGDALFWRDRANSPFFDVCASCAANEGVRLSGRVALLGSCF